jgi:alpha-beta hydrolase superfamily lysophospholipase
LEAQTVPVAFPTAGGLVLRGHRWGAEQGWALLVHDEGEDLDVWRPLVGELIELGLCVLAFDLRGHGASDDPWEPRRARADVLAALRFARAEGARRLYLVGAGAGATAALAASGRRKVEALVLYSPRTELPGVSPEALRLATAPKLIIVGGLDAPASAAASEVLRHAIGWAVLESPPVDAQGTHLLASDWAEQVVEHTVGFLRDYL